MFSDLVLVLGLSACLLHFYFSAKPNKVMGGVSKVGITVLMLSFGASFGYTVMGRISLAIGRFQELLGLDKTETLWTLEGSEEPLSTMSNIALIRWMTVLTALAIIALGVLETQTRSRQGSCVTDPIGIRDTECMGAFTKLCFLLFRDLDPFQILHNARYLLFLASDREYWQGTWAGTDL